MSVKEQVLQAIQRLLDDIDFRDVADEIALLAAVDEAEKDIQEGRLVSNEEMRSVAMKRTLRKLALGASLLLLAISVLATNSPVISAEDDAFDVQSITNNPQVKQLME